MHFQYQCLVSCGKLFLFVLISLLLLTIGLICFGTLQGSRVEQCEIHQDTLHNNKNSGLSENDEKEEVPCSGSLLKQIVLSTTDVQEIMTCLETIREREQRISNLLQRAAVNKECQ